MYDETKFIKAGIAHRDIFYKDGSCPKDDIIQEFLDVCENTPGAIAIHCKAGLGRTGSCIGMYVMKHFKMNPPSFIGWIRMCRPGSVIGPQQQFLCYKYQEMLDVGEDSIIFNCLTAKQKDYILNQTNIDINEDRLKMTALDKKIASGGEKGQGNYLTENRKQ